MENNNIPIKFDIYSGSQVARTEIVTERAIKIGRLSSSHVRLDDESVGRVHAMIEVNDAGEVVILDLGSPTGTYLNGERILGRQALKSGSTLKFGEVKVKITIAGQPAVVTAVQRATVKAPLMDEEDVPGQERALEILTVWGPTVIDVKHYTGDAKVMVGDAKGTDLYLEPSLLPCDPFELASTNGRNMVVNVPDGVQGEVMIDGKISKLEDMRAEGKLVATGMRGARALSLPPRARCRMHFGVLTVLVNSVPAPPPMRKVPFWKTMDRAFFTFFAVAVLLEGLFMALVFSIPEDADSLSINTGLDLNDRFVSFLLTPEEELKERSEKLSDLFDELEEAGKEVAAKAAGDEGSMGKVDSTETNKAAGIQGPADNQAIQFARAQARAEGAAMASAAIGSIEGQLTAVWGSGDRTIGSDAVNAFGNMFGDSIGEAQGFGGFGMAGVGRGGGGFGENSIGIGNIGTAGRGGMGGSGGTGYGKAKGATGAKGAKLKVVPGIPTVMGSLTADQIRRVVQQHAAETRQCYNKELQSKHDLAGKIVVKFTIAGTGKVAAVSIAESTMKNVNVENCLRTNIKSWRFPEPKGGGSVTVNYPFTFSASE